MKGLRILVVDDEAVMRQLFEHVLGQHQVVTVGSAEEALGRLSRGETYDLAFIDIRLPGQDGVEVLRKLKQQAPRTQAIVMTGFAEEQRIAQALEAGAERAIKKPFDLQVILRLIEEASTALDRTPKVLVVDDDAPILELFRQVESANGHQVRCAQDAASALAALRREVFDLVFLDIQLPDRNGLEVLRDIRQQYPTCPVVLITGVPEYAADVARATALGAMAGLRKPFNIQAILELVRQVQQARKA